MGTINGVTTSKVTASKWTHWGELKNVNYTNQEQTDPGSGFPETPAWRPTIRKGNKGDVVRECQRILDKLGYNLGICGVDGDYGTATDAAVRAFQREHGLIVDGVCGPMTWDALDKAVNQSGQKPAEKTYTVTITGLDKTQAEAIAGNYPGALIKED